MSTPLTEKTFLSAREVAALIGVTTHCIRRWGYTRPDDFPAPAIRTGRVQRWRRLALEAWIEEQERR